MKNEPFVIERIYNATISAVWKAITNKDDMKKWYFDLKEFKAEVGFEFHFMGGSKEKQYEHICKITEVIPNKKLSYSWRYKDYEGISFVTFELFDEGNQTRLKLTHTGLESFPQNNKDFGKDSFSKGWTYIIGVSLPKFLES